MGKYRHDPEDAQKARTDDRNGSRKRGMPHTAQHAGRYFIETAERFKCKNEHDAYACHADDLRICREKGRGKGTPDHKRRGDGSAQKKRTDKAGKKNLSAAL